jgi:hypothetical protein
MYSVLGWEAAERRVRSVPLLTVAYCRKRPKQSAMSPINKCTQARNTKTRRGCQRWQGNLEFVHCAERRSGVKTVYLRVLQLVVIVQHHMLT